MHDTALAAGTAFFTAYCRGRTSKILDVGSYDVNGSLRQVAPEGSVYVGLDMEAGPGVDVVSPAGAPFPFENGSFDACVSTSCFEHDAAFWETFLSMVRVVRDGGFIYLNAPSNGSYHTYPTDIWRFYPDAGLALVSWAERQGETITLMESGILAQGPHGWNDFVAVFKKGADVCPPCLFLLDSFSDATNVRIFGASEIRNRQDVPEDIRLRWNAMREKASLELELAAARDNEGIARSKVGALEGQLAAARSQVAALEAELAAVRNSHPGE